MLLVLLAVFSCAPGGGRTHTWTILSRLPLPLGYRGLRGKSTSPREDPIQHGFGQLTREGVLLTGMVTPDEESAIPVPVIPLEFGPMCEFRCFLVDFKVFLKDANDSIPAKGTQSHDAAQ